MTQVNQPDAPASSAIAIAENIQSNLSQEGGGGRAVIIRVRYLGFHFVQYTQPLTSPTPLLLLIIILRP